ncbi:MAG: sulfotransferase, partial [Anaerolineales bacterium]|nr:sulfotransferase [Anaerolineales bacterium]
MLIKRPIFINGFQRGGTNILQQLFASNPRVRGLGVEVHELFYGRDAQPVQKWLRRLAAAPVVLATRQHTFWPYRFYPRRPLPAAVGRYVDLLLYLQKQTAVVRTDGDGAPAWAERRQARALCKCVNGVVLATPLFTTMYPDATFVALVRHGLALCEGFVRRGWSAQRAGQMYRTVGQQ